MLWESVVAGKRHSEMDVLLREEAGDAGGGQVCGIHFHLLIDIMLTFEKRCSTVDMWKNMILT
jgi:hypothetical protein